MSGRPPKVDHIREAFLRSIVSAISLYDSVLKVGGINPKTPGPRLHTQHVRRVVELAFLGVVGNWEEFLEQTLVRYIAGAICNNGYRPNLRLGPASGIPHAYQLISGDPKFDPSKQYIGLSSPQTVITLAELYLEDGCPYSSIMQENRARFIAAISLRNRVAHTSTKSREDFKKVARSFLGRGNNGRLTQGYRAGDLLVDTAKRHFGTSVANGQLTYFQAYMELFQRLALVVVPK